VHGTPEARVVSQSPGKHDAISTSHTIDAMFDPHNGIETVLEDGNFVYGDGETSAWADHARYTPGDQIVLLTGSPRAIDGGMSTTAWTLRLNRGTGEAFANGDVKSTYTDLKAYPKGSLLTPSSPVHVTAETMNARNSPAVAVYTGNARLWQDDNRVEAPYIEFDRDNRSMNAHDSAVERVSTDLSQTDGDGKITNTKVTSDSLVYLDQQSLAHFEGSVQLRQDDLSVSAHQADVFFQRDQQENDNKTVISSSKVDRIIAREHVVLTQPNRRGHGEQLVYTRSNDKFVLTGGPPSIFDAEQGEVTGVSLTLFRGDDRVVVEGSKTFPTLTKTRVAR
jgi:lipopolysaccharide export system protein LptA